MSEHFSLEVQLREVKGKKVKYLRQQGILPATVYGKGVEPVTIQVNERVFFSVYRKAGRSSLIDVKIPGETKKQSAYVQDIQRHPVTRTIMHADFRVVDINVPIYAEVPLTLVGESPLADRPDIVLNQTLYQLQVHGRPANLPSSIEVDATLLDSLDKTIHVSDLPPSEDYDIVTDGEELIASLNQIRAMATAEEEAAEEEGTPEEIVASEEDEENES